jgi:serine/threonine protein kinase
MAHEFWFEQPYTEKIDLWSLGMLLLTMLTGSFPYIIQTRSEVMQAIRVSVVNL